MLPKFWPYLHQVTWKLHLLINTNWPSPRSTVLSALREELVPWAALFGWSSVLTGLSTRGRFVRLATIGTSAASVSSISWVSATLLLGAMTPWLNGVINTLISWKPFNMFSGHLFYKETRLNIMQNTLPGRLRNKHLILMPAGQGQGG